MMLLRRLRDNLSWTLLAVVFVAVLANTLVNRLIPPRHSSRSAPVRVDPTAQSGPTSKKPQVQPAYAASPEEIERVRSVEVQSALSPMIQHRDVQPRRVGGSIKFDRTYGSLPMSYAAIKRAGALEQSVEGLRWLSKIGGDRDLAEPRWAIGTQPGNWTGDDKAMLKEAQQYLIELGPALVSEGVLSP